MYFAHWSPRCRSQKISCHTLTKTKMKATYSHQSDLLNSFYISNMIHYNPLWYGTATGVGFWGSEGQYPTMVPYRTGGKLQVEWTRLPKKNAERTDFMSGFICRCVTTTTTKLILKEESTWIHEWMAEWMNEWIYPEVTPSFHCHKKPKHTIDSALLL